MEGGDDRRVMLWRDRNCWWFWLSHWLPNGVGSGVEGVLVLWSLVSTSVIFSSSMMWFSSSSVAITIPSSVSYSEISYNLEFYFCRRDCCTATEDTSARSLIIYTSRWLWLFGTPMRVSPRFVRLWNIGLFPFLKSHAFASRFGFAWLLVVEPRKEFTACWKRPGVLLVPYVGVLLYTSRISIGISISISTSTIRIISMRTSSGIISFIGLPVNHEKETSAANFYYFIFYFYY